MNSYVKRAAIAALLALGVVSTVASVEHHFSTSPEHHVVAGGTEHYDWGD